MTIRVAGVLKRPDDTPAAYAALRFISLSNFGEVLISAQTQAECNELGQYDLNLNFGHYLVEVRYGSHYTILGRIQIHQECADPSALSVLLAQSRPITPDEISYLENLLSDTQLAAGQAGSDKIIIASMRDEVEASRAQVASNADQVAQDASDTRANTATVLNQAREVEADRDEVELLAEQARQDAIDAKNAREAIEARLVDPDTDFPLPPDGLQIKAFDTHIEVYPQLANLGYYTDFEYFLRGESPTGERVYVSRGRMGVLQGLLPNRQYHFSVRTVNSQGASAYVDGNAVTTNAGLAEKELVGLEPDDNLGDILGQIDGDLTNMESILADQNATIAIIDISQKDLNTHVNTELAGVKAWQTEYADRVAEGEALVDAVVYRDPTTGQIINKAFQYSDTQYTEAGLRIDGVQAQIDLTVNNVTALDDTVTSHGARLSLAESEIQLRATYSEVDSKISGALAALEPAYSWQFNTSVDSWTGVTWNNLGYVDFVGPAAITGISFAAEDNPTFRLNVRTADHTTAGLFLSWNGGSQNILIPYNQQDDVWEVKTLNLTASDGWTGTITSLEISGSGTDIALDSVVVGKPNANEQELANITARVATVEQTLDAENARWAVYVTTDFWDANALTTTDVQQVIDGWDATWGIKATVNQINEEGTVTKANQAKIWVDGADANVKLIANSWWNAHPDNAKLSQASIDIDGLQGAVVTNVSSISGIDAEQKGLGAEQLELAYRQFLDAHGIADLEVAMAAAQSKIQANTDGQTAQAQAILDLEVANAEANARMSTIEQSVVNERQAWTSADQQMAVTMDDNLAEAKLYTRAAVNYWTDASGDLVDAPADPENPPAGWTLVEGPLSEDIRQIKVTTGDGKTASMANIAQVFEDKDGNLIARGGMVLNNQGRITGVVAHDDGSTSNLDLMGENVRIGYENNGSFIPLLSFNTQQKHLEMVGTFQLRDGTVIETEGDIKARNGDVTVYAYKTATGSVTTPTGGSYSTASTVPPSGWSNNPLYVPGSVTWISQRVYSHDGTNWVGGAWSTPAQYIIQGEPGEDGAPGLPGQDGQDGQNGTNGTNGTDGQDGAGMYTLVSANGTWPGNSTANANFLSNFGRYPVKGDVLTYTKADRSVVTTKQATSGGSGAAWSTPTLAIHGSVLATGSVTGDVLIAGTTIRGPKVEMIGGSFMRILSETAFGSSNQFVDWYGPRSVDVNGDPIMANVKESNALWYIKADGSLYFGGALHIGTSKTTAQTTSGNANASTETGDFGYEAKTLSISWSYTLSSYDTWMETSGTEYDDYVTCTVVLERQISGGSWVELDRFNGSYTREVRRDSFEGEFGKWMMESRGQTAHSKTITYNGAAANHNYRARVIARSGIIMSQKISIICIEE